jgi:hypothetical protein
MFRMDSTTMQALRGVAKPGIGNRPARVDHVHSAVGISQILFSKVGLDMNSVADQALTKAWAFGDYLVEEIRVANASISLTTAAGGVYDTAAKAGTPLVAAGQVYTALTGPTLGLVLTLAAAALDQKTAAGLFFALTTAQGAPATADIWVIGVPLTDPTGT